MATWHEDDGFWETWGPMFFSVEVEAREKATAQVDEMVRLMDLPEGAAVLDLGCGPGRHSLELSQRVYRVTGVDQHRPTWTRRGKRRTRGGFGSRS
jgi:cyclopropane fatty-acyl-phospholipid synthase-like methyltransferase